MFSQETTKLKWIIFTVSAIGGFLAMMDSNTVNVALYEIANDFNISISAAQWAVTAYILILSTFLTLFGKLNDLVSRSNLYALGYLIFAAGAFLNTLSVNLITLVLSRIIQATGASILLSNNYAIISSIFKGNERAKALGFSTALMALAGMSGPIAGGFLMHYFNWRAIFIPSILIGLTGAYYSKKYIPEISMMFAYADPEKLDYVKTKLNPVLGEKKLIIVNEITVNKSQRRLLEAIGR